MICTANRCQQGHKDCTRSACGFHLSTEEGGESFELADVAIYSPETIAIRCRWALFTLVAVLGCIFAGIFVAENWPTLAAALSVR